MEGYGPSELLQEVYGENTVKRFQWKAIARAIRAHLLLESVLIVK